MQIIKNKIFTLFTLLFLLVFGGFTTEVWGQLPYNTTMTSTHYNDSKVKVGSDGESYSQNAWSGGIFLQAGTRKNLWGNIKGEEWNWEDKYVIIALKTNSIPYQLKFKYKCNSIIASNPDWYVAESSDKSNWTTIWSTESNSTSTSALQTVDLSKSTKYIKFCYSGNYGGTYSDIKVTDQAYVHNPKVGDDEISSLDFGSGTISSGKAELSFDVEWCNVSALSVTSSNSTYFTVSPSSFGNTAKYGTQTVTVYYDRDVAVGNNHSGTITISNNNATYTKTINVTGTTTKRPQEIHWNASLAAVNYTLNAEESLTGSAIATADKEDAVITYTSSNNSVVAVSPDGKTLSAVSTGTASITASATGDDVYAVGTDSKTFTVTAKKKQTITWNQNLMGLKTNANPNTVNLNATATSNGTITYSIEDGSDGCITLGGTNNSVMTITGTPGTAYIKATQAGGIIGGEDWIAATAIKQVKVRDPNSSCDEYAISDESFTFSSGDKTSMSEKVFNLTGKPTTLTFKAKRGGLKFLWSEQKDLYIEQYANFGSGLEWKQLEAIQPGTSEGSYGPYALEETATKIRFRSGEYAEQQVYNITSARKTIFDVSETSITDDAERNVKWSKTISVTRSNIDVLDISVTSADASCPFQLSKTSLGTDCADMNIETFEVFFTPTTKNKTYTGTITITDGKATNTHTATIPLSITTVAFNQAITWNFTDNQEFETTHEPLVFNATTDATDLEVSYKIKEGDESLATLDGNTLTFTASGTLHVIAYQEGSDRYNAAPEIEKTLIITKVTPDIIENPSGNSIKYRQELSNSKLSGGTATVTLRGVANTTVAGSFAWTEPTHVVMDAAGTHDYQVTFTPTDAGMYTTNTCSVSIDIKRADASIVMKDDSVRVAVKDGIDEGADDSKLNLNNLIDLQTTDVVNAEKRDGKVTYEVIGDNKSKASIDGNIFSATVCGDYSVVAIKEKTSYYEEARDTFTVTVNKRANTLTTTAPDTKYVDDEVTEVATIVNSDGTIHTSSSDATIAYYDIVNNKIVIPNSEAKSFNQTTVTIKIWQDATARFEGIDEASAKTITLTVKKYANSLQCSWGKSTWSKNLNFNEEAFVYFTATGNKDYAGSPITLNQTYGAENATYNSTDSIIRASHHVGYAQWTVAQAENYKYLAAEATLRVDVEAIDAECFVLNDNNTYSIFTIGKTSNIALNGPGDQLYFLGSKDFIAIDYGLHVQYSTDGTNFADLTRVDLSSYSKQFGPFDLPEGTTHVRFEASTGSTLTKYVKNIQVTRKQKLQIEDKNGSVISELTMPENIVGENSTTANFYINYSTCEEVLNVVSDHEHLVVSESSFEANGHGRKQIILTYSSSEIEEIETTVTIYTASASQTLTVRAQTVRQPQSINWSKGYEAASISLPVGLTDAAPASATSGLTPVLYSTDNPSVITIADNGQSFSITGKGTAQLTASQAGNETQWAPVSDTKTIVATDKKIQVIRWEQDFTRSINPGDLKDLFAEVYVHNILAGTQIKNDSLTNLIQYSCPENDVISISGNRMTVLTYGTTSVTASVAGSEDYEEASVTLLVRVREPSTGCDDPFIVNHTEPIQIFSMNIDWTDWTTPPIIGDTIFFDENLGKPDKLSFMHEGEQYVIPVFSNIKVFRGAITVQQRIGENWFDVVGSEVTPTLYEWKLLSDVQLDENADAIRFVRLVRGQGYHNIKNVQVTLRQYLTEDKGTVNFGNVQIGTTLNSTLGFDYSNVKGDFTLSKSPSDDEELILNGGINVIEMDCGSHGHYDLPIMFKPTTLGEWSNDVTITDPITSNTITITVTANVTKGTQSIIWYPNLDIYANNPPALNATTTSGLEVSYAITAGDDVAHIDGGNVIIDKPTGSFTITASQGGSDDYNAAENVVKEFSVSKIPLTLIAPTASSITDAQTLSASILTGGTATDNNDDEVSGSWAWESPETVYSEGTHYPTVVFTPSVNPNWYSGNTTTTMVEVTLSSYRYTGDGDWSNTSHWNTGSVPGAEDNVIISGHVTINSDAEVKSLTIEESSNVSVVVNGSLTINGKSADRANYGDLFVKNGGSVVMAASSDLKVKDLIIEARLGNVEHPGSSGQISRKELVNVNGDVYFKLSLEPDGSRATLGWYDFVVPFEVDVIGGITIADAPTTPMVFNSNYAVMAYDESKRAANGKAWNKYTGTLVPGKVYTIAIDDAYDWTTVLFKKKQGASINPNTSLSTSYSNVGNEGDRGWNGLGNGTLQHCQLNLSAISATPKIQVYDHKNDNYITLDAPSYTCAIGTSFFVQVPNTAPDVSLSAASQQNRGGGGKFFAPAREDKTITEFCLALTMDGDEIVSDRLWVSANEAATGEYVIGQDLAKLGELKSSKLARMWAKNKDMNLCDIEMPLVYGQASCELNMYAPKQATYTLAVEEAPEDADLFLTYNGKVIWNLTSSPAEIVLNPGVKTDFGLILKSHNAPEIAEGVDNIDEDNHSVRKVLIDNIIYVITPDGAMYDVNGKLIR